MGLAAPAPLCYISGIMNKRTTVIVAGALLLGLVSATRNAAEQTPRSFQLIYHSDTRGYYRPCG
jgi:hypothetical protein